MIITISNPCIQANSIVAQTIIDTERWIRNSALAAQATVNKNVPYFRDIATNSYGSNTDVSGISKTWPGSLCGNYSYKIMSGASTALAVEHTDPYFLKMTNQNASNRN